MTSKWLLREQNGIPPRDCQWSVSTEILRSIANSHRGQFLDILVTDSEGRKPYVLGEFCELRVRKHGNMPDQLVYTIWLR